MAKKALSTETAAEELSTADSPPPTTAEPTPLPKPVPGVRPISLKEARSTAKR